MRKKVDNLIALEDKAKADREKAEREADKAAEDARRKAEAEGTDPDEAAAAAAEKAEKENAESVRKADLETMKAAQEVSKEMKEAEKGAAQLDVGLHPHGAKWWRYRYEHSYIEACMMIFISGCMLMWKAIIQKGKAILDRWALPFGTPPPTAVEMDLGYKPGRDDGSLWMVLWSGLADMMLTSIMVFCTVWVICKTTLFDYVPYWFSYLHGGDTSGIQSSFLQLQVAGFNMHVPQTGDQYRALAIDLSSIYFLALLFYFMLMATVAHHAKYFTHQLADEFLPSPRSERSPDAKRRSISEGLGQSQAHLVKTVMGEGLHDFHAGKKWFQSYMPLDLADRSSPEAEDLKNLWSTPGLQDLCPGGPQGWQNKKNWENFPLSKYLIMNVHVNMSSSFSFGFRLWIPIVVTFIIFTFLHRYMQVGYVRIMILFASFAFLQLIFIGYYCSSISSMIKKENRHDAQNIHDRHEKSPGSAHNRF